MYTLVCECEVYEEGCRGLVGRLGGWAGLGWDRVLGTSSRPIKQWACHCGRDVKLCLLLCPFFIACQDKADDNQTHQWTTTMQCRGVSSIHARYYAFLCKAWRWKVMSTSRRMQNVCAGYNQILHQARRGEAMSHGRVRKVCTGHDRLLHKARRGEAMSHGRVRKVCTGHDRLLHKAWRWKALSTSRGLRPVRNKQD